MEKKTVQPKSAERLPASECNDAVEKYTAAETWPDPRSRDVWFAAGQSQPSEPDVLSTDPKEPEEPIEDDDDPIPHEAWLRQATKGLHFPPDRRRVKRELAAHIDDRVESLTKRGLTRVAARKKAVEMMGDPEEIGELLRQVHRPWMGWALRLIRLTLLALVIVLSVKVIDGTDNLRFLSKNQMLQEIGLADGAFPPANQGELYTAVAERSWTGGDSVEIGAFTVRFEDVLCRYYRRYWIEEDGTVKSSDYTRMANVLLRFTGAPWEKLPYFDDFFRIVDDKGREYSGRSTRYQRSDFSVTYCRVMPWAYVVRIDFFFCLWDDVERLDIFLGKGEAAQKMSVWLEDWQIPNADAFQVVDEADVAQWKERLDDFGWYRRWEDQKELGSFASAAGQKDEVELSIPRAALETYRENPNGPVEVKQDDPGTFFYGELADCVLVFRGDTALLPFPWNRIKEKLRIVDPAQGPDAPAIPFTCNVIELYRDATVWRVWWQLSPGVETYELQYWPTQEGPAGTLTVELKEEREP